MRNKIKNFWKEFKKQWLWVNIGAYMMIMLINWIGVFLGSIELGITLLITFTYPLIIISIYYTRKSKYQRNINKLILIAGGGISLGFPIWAFFYFFFIGAPWAPLHELQGILNAIISILFLIPSYLLAGYIMYRLGKKRDFQPFM
jgi:hypothetical protein